MFAHRWPLWFVVPGVLALAGCVPNSYQYGRDHATTATPAELVVERGEDEPVKTCLPLTFTKPEFELSLATAERVEDYILKNDLNDLRIEIRYHNTSGQWRRLRENTRISPLWRYTAGSLSVIGDSIFPAKFWRVNRYNPYTDTLSINADDSIGLLQETAVAKTMRAKRWPGSYAWATSLPGLSMIREAEAANDVVGYARAERDWETEREAYRKLYPRVGRAGFRPVGPVMSIAFGIPGVSLLANAGGWALGRGVGYIYERRREAEAREEETVK